MIGGVVAAAGAVAPAALARVRQSAALALYGAAVFVGAFLLFLVQPMFGKMVIPLLGGSPAVWNTCMLFFQAALLAGYLYAHLSTRLLSVRQQAVVHCGLLAGAGLLLPVSVRGAVPEGGEAPIPWLLAVMLTSVGPPFLVLAGTGPILQRWFSRSAHPDSRDPYRLYAASNLGSMVALLAYPVLVEPRLPLLEQRGAWAAGYLLLGLTLAGCAALAWPAAGAPAEAVEAAAGSERVPLRRRALWLVLSFVPSSLLLGATTYLTTDLTAVPLLWVLPLALYLLSFTLVFARRPPVPHSWMLRAQPALLLLVALMLLENSMQRPALALPAHLAALFVTAMVCHGELVRTRPPASRLTEFYLWIAVGGALGGVFNVLLAPVLFSRTWEYPLMLVLACLARPWPAGPLRAHLRFAPYAVALVTTLLLLTGEAQEKLPVELHLAAAAVAAYLLTLCLGRTPLWLMLCIGTMLAVRARTSYGDEGQTLLAARSFYGHYEVYRTPVGPGYHVLTHGSTLHGAQSLDPGRRREPLTYYIRGGPLGDVFASMGISTHPRRVAVVGLGTGATAAYAAAGEEWTFYELDPGIERIARDPRLFTYLAESPARVRVVLGDARLSLARGPERAYDLIVLDAFSSDAIPVHLLTREALDVYLDRLAEGGRLAVHVSNRYLDLEPVVAALARERGLAARVRNGPPPPRGAYENNSEWIVVARTETELGPLDLMGGWRPPRPRPGIRGWTDDFSSILSVFSW